MVEAPARTPLRYGLFSVVQTPTDEDSTHARMGVRYEPGTCDPAELTCLSCPDTNDPEDKESTEAKALRGATPFTVFTRPVCSSVGWVEEAQQRAEAALRRGEERAVEAAFWTGTPASGCPDTTPHLASNVMVTGDAGPNDVQPVTEQTAAVDVAGGSVVGIVHGISLLEEALSECYGNEGVLHVPTAVATWMQRYNLLTRDGLRYRSPAGHLVAVGSAYPGTGPDGSDPGDSDRWVFATGAVFMRRSPIQTVPAEVASALNKSTNDLGYTAERTYVVGWDCCHFAAQLCIAQDNLCL